MWLFASVSTSKPAKGRIGGSAWGGPRNVNFFGGGARLEIDVSRFPTVMSASQRPGHRVPGIGAAVARDGRPDLLAEGDVADRVEDERADDERNRPGGRRSAAETTEAIAARPSYGAKRST